MNRKEAISEYLSYDTYVLRDGSVHKISVADLLHADDKFWDVNLILYPPESNMCPGNLDEASGFIVGLKKKHVDCFDLIKQGLAISVNDLPKNPYVILD